MAKKKSNVSYQGTGRRKSSVARVYLTPGTGKIMVGTKTLEDYLPQEILRMVVKSPFVVTGTEGGDVARHGVGRNGRGAEGGRQAGDRQFADLEHAVLDAGRDAHPQDAADEGQTPSPMMNL